MKKLSLLTKALSKSLALALALPGVAQVKVDPQIPGYTTISGVSGNLSSVGSDTLNNLMTYWSEGFGKLYPTAKFQVEGKGSNTAPPALIAGTAQLAPMSREMKSTEIDEFEKKFGYKPTAVRVAIDALAVYVNKDNPLQKLTLPEIDAIFSKGRKLGHGKDLVTWGELGLSGDWAQKAIRLYGRNSASGTYNYFKDHALGKGDYKDTVKEQVGSATVVQSVTGDLQGIGYSGIGYRAPGVRPLAVAAKAGATYFDPSDEDTVYSGKYPLARFLYIYVNRAPGKPLDPLVGEFLRYVLSSQGQEVVVKDGYLPIKAKVLSSELEKLGFPAIAAKATPQEAGAKKD